MPSEQQKPNSYILTRDQEAECRLAPRVCLNTCLQTWSVCRRVVQLTRRFTGPDDPDFLVYCTSHGLVRYTETEAA